VLRAHERAAVPPGACAGCGRSFTRDTCAVGRDCSAAARSKWGSRRRTRRLRAAACCSCVFRQSACPFLCFKRCALAQMYAMRLTCCVLLWHAARLLHACCAPWDTHFFLMPMLHVAHILQARQGCLEACDFPAIGLARCVCARMCVLSCMKASLLLPRKSYQARLCASASRTCFGMLSLSKPQPSRPLCAAHNKPLRTTSHTQEAAHNNSLRTTTRALQSPWAATSCF